MKSIILAAGEGKRLRPYTLDRPKCLVEIEGISLLDRQLDVLKSERITDVTLIGGYRSELLTRPGVGLVLNDRFGETNMVRSLFCAESQLQGNVVLSYGDIVYSREILRTLLLSDADISIVIDLGWYDYWVSRSNEPLNDLETLRIDSEGYLLEIGQKPISLKEIQGQYIGLMKFSATGLDILRRTYKHAESLGSIRGKALDVAYMTDLLQLMIDQGERLRAVKISGDWVEVDTVSDLESEITRSRLRSIVASSQFDNS